MFRLIGGFGVTISIHAPQWGATVYGWQAIRDVLISIHAPQWGATGFTHGVGEFSPISIHAPQWGATDISQHTIPFIKFQSTHPSGVRPRRLRMILGRHGFQSTHPSGVRLTDYGRSYLALPISIHAPQWGATRRLADIDKAYDVFQSTHPSGVRLPQSATNAPSRYISIHAPQWGATIGRRAFGRHWSHFNPRTPVGCDFSWRGLPPTVDISIHAPQWGATMYNITGYSSGNIFQSTHPSGVRLSTLISILIRPIFQSTHPSGVRPGWSGGVC